ncbi:MAG TPA: SAM-dependent methyltransferase [Firmicutes bacterium]|nr:SAM-dependent methyltransferase [Candidatus Fermentithermobacillaceae bacterium]
MCCAAGTGLPDEIALPPRLQALVSLVPPVDVVADVGTGDALVPVALIRTGKARKVIACDKSAAALDVCRGKLEQYGLWADELGSIELREGDGLSPLKRGETQVTIIAGMGGLTITGILSRGPLDVAGTYVLGPMSHQKDLRLFLHEAGFTLVDEAIVRQTGKFYEFEVVLPPPGDGVCVSSTAEQMPDRFPLMLEGEIGALLWKRRDPILKEYLVHREGKLRALEGRLAGTPRAEQIGTLRKELLNLLSKWDSR